MRHKDDIGDSTLGLIGKCIARSCQSCQKMVGSKNGDNAIIKAPEKNKRVYQSKPSQCRLKLDPPR
jgi:hypothetical protein